MRWAVGARTRPRVRRGARREWRRGVHDTRPRIDLLLAHADDRAPMLPGVDRTSAGAAPAPEPRPKPDELWSDEDQLIARQVAVQEIGRAHVLNSSHEWI